MLSLDVPMTSFPTYPPGFPSPDNDSELAEKRQTPVSAEIPVGATVHQISTASMFMLKERSSELLRLICDTRDRS